MPKLNKLLNHSIHNQELYFSDQEDQQPTENQFDNLIKRESHHLKLRERQNRANFKLLAEDQHKETPISDEKPKPYCCGCGQKYGTTSSLYLHIRSKHRGVPPQGSVGGPKGIIKIQKQECQRQQEGGSYTKQEEESRHNKSISDMETRIIEYPFRQESDTLEEQFIGKARRERQHSNQQESAFCHLCGKGYSCKGALKIHLKNKHESEPLQQQRPHKTVPCPLCHLHYASKSALSVHMSRKHGPEQISQALNREGIDSQFPKLQKCGCGRRYESRSALNLHISRKHGGVAPAGTSEKISKRDTQSVRDQLRNFQIESYFRSQRIQSEQNQNSIYDSESEQERLAGKNQPEPLKKNDPPIISPHNEAPPSSPLRDARDSKEVIDDPSKPFKCGCGKPYSCSSALNLHIKKNHNWIVPEGTIGGPRGIRCEDETVSRQTRCQPNPADIVCRSCSKPSMTTYFKCLTCASHFMCSECFWGSNNFGPNHEWILKDK